MPRDPLEDLLNDTEIQGGPPVFSPTLPIGPAGGIPKENYDNFICSRGPCKFLYAVKRRMKSGNVSGDPGSNMQENQRFCTAVLGDATPLTDERIEVCSHWEPTTKRELKRRNKAQQKWIKDHQSELNAIRAVTRRHESNND